MQNEEYQILRDYALKLLTFRPRSISEIQSKLIYYCRKYKIPQTLYPKIIAELEQKNLLNDEEFVKWWVEQRQSFRPKGKIVIRMELLAKGVNREIIDKVLASDQNKNSELVSAEKIVYKKINLYKNLPARQIKRKLEEHLLRRGFTWDIIRRAVDSGVQKE